MVLDWFLVVIGFIWLISASYFDIKTREIPDWLNFSLIAIGLGSRGIYSLFLWDAWFFLSGLLGFGIFFIIALVLYYGKQWGGGDSKLLMGLGAMFGSAPILSFFNPNYNLPFLLILVMNILIFGAIYGLIYAFVLGMKKWKYLKKEIKKSSKAILFVGLILFLLSVVVSFILDKVLFLYFILFGFSILVFSFILFLTYCIDRSCMFVNKKVEELTVGDWVHKVIYRDGKIVYKVRRLGLKEEDIKKLKKINIRSVKVKEGMPFVPAFLIGFIVSVIFGNILFFI